MNLDLAKPLFPSDREASVFRGKVLEPELAQAVERLHRLHVQLRWTINLGLMLMLCPGSLWALRSEFALWADYFTWSAVRYGLAYHPVATLGLLIPISMVTSTLVWQTRNILWGLPQREIYRLEKHVKRIQEKGKKHWLWVWIWEEQG